MPGRNHPKTASRFTAPSLAAQVVALLVIGAVFPAHLPAQTLTTAREVAAFILPEEDAQPAKVQIEATVTFIDPGNTIFLKDDTGATFVRAAKSNPRPAIGDRLRISGVTHNGLIIGGINPTTIQTLGSGPTPAHQEVTLDDLASGKYHYHLVSVSGVGRSLHRLSENSLSLRLLVRGRVLEVRFDEAPLDPEGWVDAELTIRGLAAGDINDRRELVMPYIRVRSIDDVQVTRPAPTNPFEAAAVPLSELQRAITDSHRVKVRGTALSSPLAGGVFLRQDNGSVFVRTTETSIRPGNIVDALGFPEMGAFSAHLAEAECRVSGSEPPPAPVSVTPAALSDGRDAELISVDASVLQRVDRSQRSELVVQAGSVVLNVSAPSLLADEMREGALLRLVGVCRVSATRSDGYRAKPTAYDLWLRTPMDAVVLERTSWWTPRRVAFAFVTLAALALLAVIWAALLRRQVARQLSVIEGKVQREAVAEERQRIAREFHDTLEQELAGLSLRLDAAFPRVADEKARDLLDQQRRLLNRLQTDTRDFVWDLRDASRQDAPLDAALQSLLDHLQANTSVPLQFASSGSEFAVSAITQHHLLRIAREAVNNALKYARARRVEVRLEPAGKGELTLTITDDGGGFDVVAAQSKGGHFGIRGMHERARKIGATLLVDGSAGATKVSVQGVQCIQPEIPPSAPGV